MNWKEIYLKYKDTELMKELEKSLGCSYDLSKYTIQEAWGIIICFAEEDKGIEIFAPDCQIWDTKKDNYVLLAEHGECGDGKQMEFEQAMLWCADKFFEVVK